jgi:hypothetical protein
MKDKVTVSFYFTSGVDPLTLDSSADYKPHAKAGLHSQIDK